VDALKGYDAVIERAHEMLESDPEKYYMPNQYKNPDNPRSHEETTAPEIEAQTPEDVTAFVAGVGTGGTITGVGRGLNDDTRIVAMEPDSEVHGIDGLKFMREGDHIVPETYDGKVYDDKVYVSTDDAYAKARELRERYENEDPEIVDAGQYEGKDETVADIMRVDGSNKEGSDESKDEVPKDDFLVGTSSGANITASISLAEEMLNNGHDEVHIVTMFCDRGDKYTNNLWREYFS